MFADERKAQELIDRICVKLNREFGDDLWRLFVDWPNSDEGLSRFDRIVRSMSGAGILADHIVEMPELASIFVAVICTSSHLTDLIIQNPEFTSLLFDPEVLSRRWDRNDVVSEGDRLLASVTSYSHALDRLRFMKQERTVILAAQDIGGLKDQPDVWRGISELAVGLLELAHRVTWQQFSKRGDYPVVCPVGIAVMGKLGGLELNYSSDVDLIFVNSGGVDDEVARKYCEFFRSAVADRMGRGDLYRVDLRLRPFGSQGPIVCSKGSIEKYYDQYAEPWEQVALIRSYLLSPDSEMVSWWEGLRSKTAFAGARSELALGNLIKMRRRAEEQVPESDLKRGAGGIRDVELSIQVIQLLNGKGMAELRGRPTVEMLGAAVQSGLLEESQGRELIENYQFLRRLEHRVQILSNRQVYALPESIELREVVAFSLGYGGISALEDEVRARRAAVRWSFNQLFEPLLGATEQVVTADMAWLSEVRGGTDYAPVLLENASSRARLGVVVTDAPGLIPHLQNSPGMVDQLISGEVEEDVAPENRFASLGTKYDRTEMQRALRNGWLRLMLQGVLFDRPDVGERLAAHFDAAVAVFAGHWGQSISVIGLGSYAGMEMGPDSDADLLVLVGDESERDSVERGLQSSLIEVSKLKAMGVPFSADFRLRPEGRNGRLAVTPEALRKYSATFMEPWERFALGRSRLVYGDEKLPTVLRDVIYGETMSRDDFGSLLHMKTRIERERVKPGLRDRHIKLGNGGIDDIVWLCQLWMLKRAEHVRSLDDVPIRVVDRLSWLLQERLLDVIEYDVLRGGFEYLMELRIRLYMLGIGDDVFPENPDRLLAVGRRIGIEDPNLVLAHHHRHIHGIRGVFEESLRRMTEDG